MADLAIIMAGGAGKRLYPHTRNRPKALIEVGQLPIAEILIRQLKASGFNRVVFALFHEANQIQDYFGSGAKWGVTIQYAVEEEPLGTIGPIRQIRHLPKDFLILNCDILCDLNFRAFFDAHLHSKKLFSLASTRQIQKTGFGVLDVSETGQLKSYQEKPYLISFINMGIYAANKNVLKYIPKSSPFNLDELVHILMQKNLSPHVFRHFGEWLDIGSSTELERASEVFSIHPELFLNHSQSHPRVFA